MCDCPGCGKIVMPVGPKGDQGPKGDTGATGPKGDPGADGSCVVLGAGCISTVTPQTLGSGFTLLNTLTNSLPAGTYIIQHEGTLSSDISPHHGTYALYTNDGSGDTLISDTVRSFGNVNATNLDGIYYKTGFSQQITLASPATIKIKYNVAVGNPVVFQAGSYTYLRIS